MTSLLLSLALFFQAATPAPSLTGTWTLNGSVQGVSYTATCTFTQTDATLTGDCVDDKASHKTTGKIDGDKITFTHDSEYNGDKITLSYTAKLDASGQLTGTIDVEPYAVDGTFTAVRTPPPAQK